MQVLLKKMTQAPRHTARFATKTTREIGAGTRNVIARLGEIREDQDANMGGIAAGAVIGFALGLVILFVLSPIILDQAAAVTDSPNASATDIAMVGVVKLAWWITPLLGAFAGGGAGYLKSRR